MTNNRRIDRRKNIRLIPASRSNQKRVAIYCRVSTTRGSQEESLDAQRKGLQKIINDNPNWILFKVYTDTESGKNIYRPGFQEIISDSYENYFDIILVKSISRFNRNTVDLLDTVNKLRLLGIEVIFNQENLSSKDRDSDLVMALSASLAQSESESLSEAIKWGLKRGFESGESKLYTRKCFGYTQSETGELVFNEEQAEVVRKIFDLYLSGYSVDMIIQGECMVISLEEVKLYLRVDGDEENTLITNFITTAEELCEGILRYPLSEFITVPETLKQAILFAVANIYEQRENFDVKSVVDVMTRLLFAYRVDQW